MADRVIQGMLAERAYGSIYSGQYAEAAKSAKANETARRLGMDPDIVESALPDMMAEDRLRRRVQEAQRNEAYARIMANTRLAKSGIDDDQLPKVAERTDKLIRMRDLGIGGSALAYVKALTLGGLARSASGFYGLGEAASRSVGAEGVARWFGGVSASQRAAAERAVPQTDSRIFNDVLMGAQSVLPSMGTLVVAGLTRKPTAAAAMMGGMTGGESYREAREEGLGHLQALSYGAQQGAIEAGAEAIAGRVFVGSIVNQTPLGRAIAKQVGIEMLTELPTTLAQSGSRFANIGVAKGQSVDDWLKGIPDELISTAIATASSAGLTAGGSLAVTRVVQNAMDRHFDRRRAEVVDGIMEAAGQSETRTANPSDFREALNQLVGDTDAASLYIPIEELEKALPENVAEDSFWGQYQPQIEEARRLGGDVVIPLAEAATGLAGSPQWQQLRDAVRTRPGGVSISEAKAKRSPEELQAMADQVSNGLQQSVRQVVALRAREVVGNWSQQLGYQGERANVVNRLLSSALATRFTAENARRAEQDLPPTTIEQFAADWLPQATRMAQADFDTSTGGTTLSATGETGEPQATDQVEAGAIAQERRDGGRLFGIAQLLDEPSGTVLGTDQPLEGAPTRLTVPGRGPVEVRAYRVAREAAASYMRRAGLNYVPAARYAKIDEARAKRIAQAFEEMPHAPDDPVVAAAYDAMIEETIAQFQLIKDTGLQIEFIDGEDPYAASPRLAILDVVENNHLWVFPTEGGFGQGEVSDSPMLRQTDEFIDGRRLLVNDVFRIVHDYFGHVKDGHGFRAEGEENAWQSHAAMYSPLARRAMTTETRGQNSWLNFGPYAEHNKTASAKDTVYAPQKVGLMPEWASEEGMLAGLELGEPVGRPIILSPDELIKYLIENDDAAERYENDRGEWEEFEESLRDQLGDFDHAILRRVPLEDLEFNGGWIDPEMIEHYEALTTEAPPFVVRGKQIFDGNHRVTIRRKRGEAEAWAYVIQGQTFNQSVRSSGKQIVYHGTPFEFDAFESPTGKAIWFAASKSLAGQYANPRRFRKLGDGRIVEATLDFDPNKVLDIDPALDRLPPHGVVPDSVEWAKREFGFDLPAHGWERYGQDYAHQIFRSPAFAKAAREAGFDVLHVTEGGNDTWGMLRESSVTSPEGQTLYQSIEVPGFASLAPYLTAEEKANLREASKKKILDIVRTLPKAEEAAAVAVAGRAKKGWYARSAQAIVDVFGIGDAPRFAALLAALSPQNSVEMNFFNALRVWTFWNNAGRPTDRQEIVQLMGEAVAGAKGSGSLLNAWINNSVRALTERDPMDIRLSGPKVNSFMNNLVGEVNEVTNDTWMANYADVQPELFKSVGGEKGPGYKAFNAMVRRAAEIATERTGINWSPSEIQEAVWSFARTLYLRRDMAGEDRSMQDLLDAGQITHADIAATPDFAVLFGDGIFRTILEEGGYDTATIESIGRDAGLDREVGSVAEAEGTGFDPDAFRGFLGEAATRLERVRQRRRGDQQANDAQQELVFNQAVNPAEEIFYSNAAKVVAEAKQERASPQQWKALLTPGKTPGIKSEEIEWTGIHDWLDMQQGSIDKGALLQVLRNRGIQVEEVVLGDPKAWDVRETEDGRFAIFSPEGNQGPTYSTEAMAFNALNDIRNDQFRNWSSDPSNDTYRELLITLPLGQGSNPERAPSTHWDVESVVAHARFMEKIDADGKRVLFIEEVQSDWHQKGRDQGYEQLVPDEVDEAARLTLREAQARYEAVLDDVVEAGGKTLMEVARNRDGMLGSVDRDLEGPRAIAQRTLTGDLGEAGDIRAAIGGERFLDLRAEYNEARLRVNEATQAVHNLEKGKGIPNAPFKSSWPALVMKRMIRWAVDNGYDKIAWTTGEEQAERYSLGSVVDMIEIRKHGPEKYAVDIDMNVGTTLVEQGLGAVDENENLIMRPEQLKEAFGADLSKRMMEGADSATEVSSGWHQLRGLDLRVGGEGMKAFYDRNLVNITNDIIKKYGAKVGHVNVVNVRPGEPSAIRALEAFGSRDAIRSVIDGRRGEEIIRDPTGRTGGFTAGALQSYLLYGDDLGAHPGFEITDKLRDAASGGFPLFQQRRGNISIVPGEDGMMKTALIRAFEAANFSTAVHELGHFFLEDLRRRALGGGSTDQERADWETFKAWAQDLGQTITDDGPVPVEAHEYFARGFERFTWEGQSPSMGLRHLFFRLREFMLELYRTATRFNAPITPEIRDVMGRMLVSDEELQEQRARMNLAAGAVDQLMTEQERQAYNDLTEEVRQDARDSLFTRILSGLRQERMVEARERKNAIREEVRAEVDAQPVFQALKLLRVGQPLPDGSFARVKLSRQQLIDAYGADIEQRLPRTVPPIVADDNTMDADQIAALTGFESGDQLIRTLLDHAAIQTEMRESGDRRSPKQRMVEDIVAERYREEVGDPLEDLEEEAQAALASDRQADLLSMELRAMARKSGRKPTPWRLAKEWAEKRVRLQTSQEAVSGRAIQMYARNVSKAAAQAEEALVGGDMEEAFAAKQRQLLNTALLSEAKKVKEEVEKATQRMRRIASRPTIPSVDQDYLEQAHQLLEDVDLKTKSQAEVARRMAFEDWYLERVAEGIEPSVPARFRAHLGQTHWSQLPIDDLIDLDRAVGQIIELGRLKKRLRDGQQARDFDEGVMEMVGQAETDPERRRSKTTDPERTFGGRVASRLRGIDAAMIKLEQMVEWLDNGEKNGPWRRMLFGPIADAQTREKGLTERYVSRLNEMIKAMPREQARALDRQVDTPELVIRNSGHSQAGEPFRGTKDQILVMAMNWGNEGNRQRLLDGFGWQEAELLAVFDRLLTKEDWDFVQGVWDLVDELWPEIEQLERRVNGVAPEKVEATEVQTRHGIYRGGYFPVIFDPNESTRADLDEASKLSPNGAWHQVSTRAGASRGRVERVHNRPLLLNMGVITRHIGEVIHDVTHREAVVQARKILSDNRIRAVVNSRLGPEYYRRMGSWLENVATPNVSNSKSDPAMISIARHLNKGISLVGLGFRITTVLVQPLGLSNAMSEIGVGRVVEGLRIFVANPRRTYNEIVNRSGEMRSRFSTMDATIDDMMTEARGGKLRVIGPRAFVRYAFHGILYVDMVITSASWTGAFNKAMAEGGSEDDAVAYADSVIRKTQGAGGRKDRSSIMYENDFARSFWPFFSYLNALYNQQRDVFHRAKRIRSAGDALEVTRRAWWVMAVPTLLQAMIFGEGPDEDDDDPESWAAYLTKSVMLGNLSAIPGVGAISAAIGSGYGYRSNAWQGIGEDIKKSWADIDRLISEDDEQLKGSTIQKVLSTTGIVLAKPLGQPAATARGIYDFMTGEAQPEDAGDWYYLLTKGRIPDQPTAIQQLVGSEEEEAQ
jgi:ribosomal protein S11